MNKHKHYEMIVAWAAGETLEFWSSILEKWVDFDNISSIDWNFEPTQYRIKPDKELSKRANEQKPVAWVAGYKDGNCVVVPIDGATVFPTGLALFTAPAKREWVGLTDDEIKGILDCGRGGIVDIKKAEQILKEKNHV